MAFRSVLSVLLLLGATSLRAEIRVERDPEADFSGRTSWAWHETAASTRLREQEPFLEKHLRAAVTAGLAEEGLSPVDLDPAAGSEGKSASLLVSIDGVLRQRLAVSEQPDWHPRLGWWDEDTHVRSYDELSVTIDLRDGATQVILWRGKASEPQAAEGRTQRQVERMVKRLLNRYPPRRGTGASP